MVKTLSLASALLKNAGSPFDVRFGKKKGRIAQASIYLLLLLGLLPILAGLFIVYREMYGLFAPTGDLAYATGTMLNLLCVVIFIFTLFSAPSIYYLSKDVGFLLPLPIRPAQIIGAKFIVSLVYEYVFALFLLAPMYAAYVVKMPAPALTINMALAFAALPVAPMVYATVIVMLLMRLSGFGKNRDAYNMVVGVAAICFGLAVTMYSSNLNLITTEQVVSMVDGNRGALGALKSIFPGSVYAGRAIADADFLAQAADLLISALTAAAFIMLAQLIYFKGVVGVSESNAPQGRMTREGIMRGAYERKILPSYFMKEILTLVRSPVAFLNCVLIVFILPPLTAAPMLMNMGGAGADLGFNLSIDFSDPRVFAVAMSVAAAAGLLMSSVAMAAPTSISREGSNYIFMKYIPVPYAAQIEAKALCGAAIGVLGSAFLALMSAVFMKIPIGVVIPAFILMVPGCFGLNYFGVVLDLLKPKLVWDSEQRAIKQNMNAVAYVLGGMTLAFITSIAGALFLKTPLAAFAALFTATSAFAFFARRIALGYGSKLMASLDD